MWLIALAVLAFLIIAGLSFYAGKLLFLLKKQKQQQEKLRQQQEQKAKERKEFQVSSIKTIAAAVIREECELSEGAIRACVLLDNYAGSTDGFKEQYPNCYSFYEKIRDFATHEARKKLSKQDRMRQDKQRWMLEVELKDKLLEEFTLLSDFQNQPH